jgi:hypothetical protein
MLKTKKIDVRLDQELFDLVDNYAKSSRLSRAQVVERALLQLFGRPVMDNPITQGNAAPLKSSQKSSSKPSNVSPPVGAEIATINEPLDSGSAPARRPSSRQAG